MAIVVLRHCYKMSRREAGLLPRWERELLIDGGKRLLGIGQDDTSSEGEGGFSSEELRMLTTPGLGATTDG